MEEISNDLKGFLKENEFSVVDFWAPWCGPCMGFAPVFEKMSKKYPKIKFAKCNIDENSNIASEVGVMSIPTVIFYIQEKEMDRMVGAMPEPVFEEKLKSLLSR